MKSEAAITSQPTGTAAPVAIINEAECLRRVPVSRRTWFSYRAAGKIPTIKIGRRCLYHWPSVEAALLRMQRGGFIIIFTLFVALATSAMGHTINLGVSPKAHPIVGCILPLGNTLFGQVADQNVQAAGSSSLNVSASGLAGAVAAVTVTALDRASSGVNAASPFSTAWDHSRFAIP
jgi:hypothetical protein